MMYFFITLFVLMLVFVLMGVGLIVRNRPIKGTCASLSDVGLKESCEICGGDQTKCENKDKPRSHTPMNSPE
jgi:hypothetical protein